MAKGINVQITAGGGGTPISYALERNIDSAVWTTIEATLAYTASPQTYQDDNGGAGFSDGAVVEYRATATNTDGTSALATVVSHTISNTTQLSTPVLVITVDSDTQVTLDWGADANADDFTVREIGSSDGTFTPSSPTSTNQIVVTGLTASTSYTFGVIANGSGSYSDSAEGTDTASTDSSGDITAPTMVEAYITDANKNQVVAIFDEPVILTSFLPWKFGGVEPLSFSGSNSNTITFTMPSDYIVEDGTPTLFYSIVTSAGEDVEDSSGNKLEAIPLIDGILVVNQIESTGAEVYTDTNAGALLNRDDVVGNWIAPSAIAEVETIDVDGATSAIKITGTAVTTSRGQTSVSVDSLKNYKMTFYAKQVVGSGARMSMADGGTKSPVNVTITNSWKKYYLYGATPVTNAASALRLYLSATGVDAAIGDQVLINRISYKEVP